MACYRPDGGIHLTEQEWDSLVGNATGDVCSILVADFNAHSEAWNCSHSEPDAVKLLDSIDRYELFLQNNDTDTHTDPRTGNKSNIDLVFSSMNIAAYL